MCVRFLIDKKYEKRRRVDNYIQTLMAFWTFLWQLYTFPCQAFISLHVSINETQPTFVKCKREIDSTFVTWHKSSWQLPNYRWNLLVDNLLYDANITFSLSSSFAMWIYWTNNLSTYVKIRRMCKRKTLNLNPFSTLFMA